MPEFPLDEVLRIQREFAKLYRSTGLLNVADNYVQVNDRALAELADPAIWDIRVVLHQEKTTFYHAHIRVKGVEFLAVLDEKELAEYGLEIPGA